MRHQKILKILCTKYMASSEVMISSTHSFAYSYRLVKKCFVKICETSKCHNFLIFQPIFIRFSLLCLEIFTRSSEIKLNLLWSSSLREACVTQWIDHPSIEQKVRGSTPVKPQSDSKFEASVVCYRTSPSVSRCRLVQLKTLCPSDRT